MKRASESPAGAISAKEKRRSQRKSVHDLKTEFKIRRNVSAEETENQNPQLSPEEQYVEKQENIYKKRKEIIDEKQSQWMKDCEAKALEIPSDVSSDFNARPFENSLEAAKRAIENRGFMERSGNVIESLRCLQQKILLSQPKFNKAASANINPSSSN